MEPNPNPSARAVAGSPVHSAAKLGWASADSTAQYEAGRPSYPDLAVDTLLQRTLDPQLRDVTSTDSNSIRLLDLGAGTGKFTRCLANRLPIYINKHFTQIIPSSNNSLSSPSSSSSSSSSSVSSSLSSGSICAVEPVGGMRSRFSLLCPSIPMFPGTGESMPSIPSSSCSVVFSAQAFHWFATQKTLEEIWRVLKPGGALALIWNTRDRDARVGGDEEERKEGDGAADATTGGGGAYSGLSWVSELETYVDLLYPPDVPRQQSRSYLSIFESNPHLFTPIQYFAWSGLLLQEGDEQMMLDRILSLSVVSSLGDNAKEEVKEKLKKLLRTHPETRGKNRFVLPYKTEIYWCFKKA